MLLPIPTRTPLFGRLAAICGLFLLALPVDAGMPSPLPSDPETYLRLSDSALFRVQSISLFAFAFVVCVFAFQCLWNYLQRGFPSLPRLTAGKAMTLVVLWGALFIVVLTMISGARELMTPGAWNKQGFTYKLAQSEHVPSVSPERRRRQHLEDLRTALWQFAATHKGAFPGQNESTAIAADLWEVPDAGGLRYQFVDGLIAGPEANILVYEPELDKHGRLVLKSNGDIVEMSTQQIAAAQMRGKSE